MKSDLIWVFYFYEFKARKVAAYKRFNTDYLPKPTDRFKSIETLTIITYNLTVIARSIYGGFNLKIEIKLDKNCLETKLIIVTEKMTDEISDLMQRLSEESPQGIVGFDGNVVLMLEPSEIVRIYAAVGKVFAVTDKKEYVLRMRLYEAEEKLGGKGFVRISNSEIINIKKAKEFDLSTAGTICVSLSNGNVSFVSRRYVSKIKKTLGI